MKATATGPTTGTCTAQPDGPQRGPFLYHTHETPTNGQITVTDLVTNTTRVLIERVDWNRIDGIVWTPWRTLLTGEEMRPERQPSLPDPQVPLAQAGLMYEVNPTTGTATVLLRSAHGLTKASFRLAR